MKVIQTATKRFAQVGDSPEARRRGAPIRIIEPGATGLRRGEYNAELEKT
jgi:hypothetical protein